MLNRISEAHVAEQQGPRRQPFESSLLEEVYEQLEQVFYSNGGYKIPKLEKELIDATGGSSSYGEVLPEGVDQILQTLAMDGSSTFCDLGCGTGRAVLQVAMAGGVAKAVGLELSAARLEEAEAALQVVQGVAAMRQQERQVQGGPGATVAPGCSAEQQQRQEEACEQGAEAAQRPTHLAPVEFIRADLARCSFEGCTHFYMCSTAFGAGICRTIAERLAATASFQALVTTRQLPSQPHLLLLGQVPCTYSWTARGSAYVYVRSYEEAPARLLANFCCRDGVCWLPGLRPRGLGLSVDEPLGLVPTPGKYVQLPSQQPALPAKQQQALPHAQVAREQEPWQSSAQQAQQQRQDLGQG